MDIFFVLKWRPILIQINRVKTELSGVVLTNLAGICDENWVGNLRPTTMLSRRKVRNVADLTLDRGVYRQMNWMALQELL